MKDLGLFGFKKRRLKDDLITDFEIMRVIKLCMVASCLFLRKSEKEAR